MLEGRRLMIFCPSGASVEEDKPVETGSKTHERHETVNWFD